MIIQREKQRRIVRNFKQNIEWYSSCLNRFHHSKWIIVCTCMNENIYLQLYMVPWGANNLGQWFEWLEVHISWYKIQLYHNYIFIGYICGLTQMSVTKTDSITRVTLYQERSCHPIIHNCSQDFNCIYISNMVFR